MGFPAIETRALPGNREDAYRAGITPRIRCGTIEDITTGGIVARMVMLSFREAGACPKERELKLPLQAEARSTRKIAPPEKRLHQKWAIE